MKYFVNETPLSFVKITLGPGSMEVKDKDGNWVHIGDLVKENIIRFYRSVYLVDVTYENFDLFFEEMGRS